MTGIRVRQENRIDPSPMTTETTSSPEAAWASLAPTARRPVRTTANDDVQPTSAATTPAVSP